MAAPSPHRFFAAWRVEAPFSAVSLSGGFYTLRNLLTRSITVLVATPHSRDDPLHECGRPCDTILSLFFTVIWLQRSQSILVQEIQQTNDIDLTCFKTFPIKATTCLPMGPCPWIGQWIRLQEQQRGAFPASPDSRWRRDALQPRQVQQGTAGWETCGHLPDGGLRCITWNTRGLVGSVFSSQKNRELKLKYFRKLLDNNNIICLQEG